jgi:hypothetical protein
MITNSSLLAVIASYRKSFLKDKIADKSCKKDIDKNKALAYDYIILLERQNGGYGT